MSNPFFSVIIPAFNCEGYMRKALDSIKAQTFKDYELIVVCDACKDRTKEIAEEYTDRIFEVNANRGYAARNKGLDEARGEWIIWCDDDDWFMDDDVFQTLADNVGKQGEDVLAFGFYWQHLGEKMNTPGRLYTAVWNKCWRREFIERIGARFPEYVHSEDDGFHKYAIPKAKIAYLDRVLYYYNFLRPGSLTWQMEQGLISSWFPGKV